MRILTLALAFGFLIVQPVVANTAERIKIAIDKIEENHRISGSVIGLSKTGRSTHKVIVYVLTDKWHIHPFERGGDGLSWASIREDGSWEIQTVRRQFPADKVAAVLVKKNYQAPKQTASVLGIPNEAVIVKDLRGTPDFRKL